MIARKNDECHILDEKVNILLSFFVIIRISMSLWPMNSLQLFVAFRPLSNIVVKRYAFSPKDRILLLNSQSKALYGPVIKTKSQKRSKPSKAKLENDNISPLSAPSDDVAPLKKPETNYGSEMYWIIGNRWNEIVGASLPTISDVNKVNSSSAALNKQTESVAKEKTISELKTENAGKFIDVKTNGPAVNQKPIPLTPEELNNVLKHPLQSDVLSTPPTDIRAPELRHIPSVGRVLQYTMPETARNALLNWKLAKISELGEQGFADLQQCE